ncbi:MAG: hypothetical protein ABL903_09115 [Methylococcales bacterium]
MNTNNEPDEMRSEYDFSAGVRGKHSKAYTQDSNVIVLEPDVAAVFHNAAAVNHALRLVINGHCG